MIRELIRRNLVGKRILLLFILTNSLYAFMLIVTIPEVMGFSGGMKLMDMLPMGYNADYVRSLLTALGSNGRNAYLFHQIPLDMVYPFLFAITYCLLLAYILKRLEKWESNFFYFCYLPLFAGLFDYSENFGIIAMLNGFPDYPEALVTITSIYSILKSVLTTIYFVVLLISSFVLGAGRLSVKKR